jgi:hypothetical protein
VELFSSKIDALFVKARSVLSSLVDVKRQTLLKPHFMLLLMKCAERERESEKEANNLVYFFSFEPVIHTIEG